MNFLKLLLVSLFVFAILPPLYAQLPPAEGIRPQVQTFLQQQMGREAALVEYSFVADTWTDAALGCPREGESYAQVITDGYRWQFLMDDGIRYELHSDGNGASIVLCAELSQPAFTYSVYGLNNPFYTIQHPNLWSVQVISPTEVNFTFRGQSACNLPEMRVLVRQDATDAATLLGEFLSSVGVSSDPANFAPLRDTGRTATFSQGCGGLERSTLASALVVAERGYLVLQSAPTPIFPIWRGVFAQMMGSFQPKDAAALPTPAPTVAAILPPNTTPDAQAQVPQAPAPPAVELGSVPLAHIFIGDVYIGALNDLPGFGVTADPSHTRQHLRPARDGLQLAYIEDDTRLYTVSLLDPDTPNLLAEDVAAGFPPAWAVDQPALAYLTRDENGLAVQTIFPDGTRQSAGVIPFVAADCPNPSAYTVDRLYGQETGNSNGNGLLFAWIAPDAFLYTPHCKGLGLNLYRAGEISELGADLRRARLSPDRLKVAAVDEDGITLIDLASQETRFIPTQQQPDQLGWDITSTQLYYSAIFPGEPLTWSDPATSAAAQAVLGVFPFESRLNTLRLYQVDTSNGVEAPLWEGSGFALGRLLGAPDGSGVVFSLIPSDRGLLTAIANGEDISLVRRNTPETALYYLAVDFANQAEVPAARLLAFTSYPVFATLP